MRLGVRSSEPAGDARRVRGVASVRGNGPLDERGSGGCSPDPFVEFLVGEVGDSAIAGDDE
jgi:hypothetical protein